MTTTARLRREYARLLPRIAQVGGSLLKRVLVEALAQASHPHDVAAAIVEALGSRDTATGFISVLTADRFIAGVRRITDARVSDNFLRNVYAELRRQVIGGEP